MSIFSESKTIWLVRHHFFFNGPISASFCYFRLFRNRKTNQKNDESIDSLLGTQTQGGRWKAQTNPLSYGGTPLHYHSLFSLADAYHILYLSMFDLKLREQSCGMILVQRWYKCDRMVRLFFNMWPFVTMKIRTILSQICQSGFSILPNEE